METLINIFLPFIFAPLLLGIINRTKAFFGGRKGVPTLQLYWDLIKLFQKGFIYSKTTTWVFRLGPIVGMIAMFLAVLIVPTMFKKSFLSFEGDIFLFLYLLGVIRFFLIVSALDTGSSFEGMGSAREAFFSALSEPIIFLVFITWVLVTKSYTFEGIFSALSFSLWSKYAVTFFLTALALFIIMLLESSRIPFDDPNTHLELTMIHEVMILDHSSFDLGLLLYTSAIKLWIFASIIVHILLPLGHLSLSFQILLTFLGVLFQGALIGIIESSMARLRMNKIHQLITASAITAVLGLILILG